MIVNIPFSFSLKDIPLDCEHFVARWVNPNDWDSVFVLYQKTEKETGFFASQQKFVAVGVEYVASHWGIQSACFGDSEYERKIEKYLLEKGLPFNFLKLDYEKARSKFKYNMETHKIDRWSKTYEKFTPLNLHRFTDYTYEAN